MRQRSQPESHLVTWKPQDFAQPNGRTCVQAPCASGHRASDRSASAQTRPCGRATGRLGLAEPKLAFADLSAVALSTSIVRASGKLKTTLRLKGDVGIGS